MERYNPHNLNNARRNRRERNATHQEAVLWHLYLKKSKTNFTRQYRIGNYILDFYAPSIKLSIEIDGGQHYEEGALAYDDRRSAFLAERGITELRFTNIDIDKHLVSVVEKIDHVLAELKR